MLNDIGRSIRAFWAALVVVCMAMAGVADAQSAGVQATPQDPNPTLFATLGVDGQIIANRWNLVRATIQPGLTPVSGTVRVSMGVGPATLTSSSAPFVSVPGVPTRVDQVVPLPRETWYFMRAAWIRVSLYADDGSEIRRVMFDDTGATTSLRLPIIHADGVRLVANVGRTSLDSASRLWGGTQGSTASVEITPGVFEMWPSVVSAAVDADALPMHPGAYESLSVVVIASSQLDLVEDAALTALKQWLYAGGRMVVVGPWRGRDLDRWGLTDLLEVDGAAIEVRPEGRHAGWETVDLSVPLDAPDPAPEVTITVARGSLGLGGVTFVPSDPSRDARLVTEAAWRKILSATFATPIPTSSYSYGTADDDDTIPVVLDELASTLPTPGTWPMVLIVVFAVGLAALLGPIDWLWLKKRRLSHWAWATAIAWIGIAATAAFLWPSIIRAGDTQLRRVAVIDAISQPDAGTSWAYRTGVTSVLTSSTGARRFQKIPDGSMWRRVRAQESEAQRAGTVVTHQLAGAMPGPIGMDIWTFNGFRDDAPLAEAPWATVRTRGEDYEVELHGLPEGTVAKCELSVKASPSALRLDLVRDETGVLRGTASRIIEIAPSGEKDIEFWKNELSGDHWLGLGLPGVRERTAGMRNLVETGEWALVQISLKSPIADFSLEERTFSMQTTTYRILAPLPRQGDAGDKR